MLNVREEGEELLLRETKLGVQRVERSSRPRAGRGQGVAGGELSVSGLEAGSAPSPVALECVCPHGLMARPESE